MAKLKAVVEDLDDVPEGLREFYVEKDAKFYLDLGDDLNDHHAVANLSSAHKRQKADNVKLKGLATELVKLGIVTKEADGTYKVDLPEGFSAEEWDRLKALAEADDDSALSDEEKAKRKDAARKATEQFEQRIAALETKHGKEIAGKDGEISRLRAQVEKLIVDTALDAAMDKALIDPKYRKAVRAMIRSDVKVVGDEGELSAVVETDLDPETPLEKYVENWAQSDEGRIYVSQAKGGGAEGDRNGLAQKGVNPWNPKTKNLTEQGRILIADPAKARRMAAEFNQTIPE